MVVYRPDHPNAKKNGGILEHRLVMSEKLGRPLKPDETVHHKNGVRNDNRSQNLELRVHAHGPGQAIADVVEWSVYMLSRYAPELLAQTRA